MDSVTGIAAALRRHGKQLGPYLMLELLLPGGSLVALALFLYRQRPLRFDAAGKGHEAGCTRLPGAPGNRVLAVRTRSFSSPCSW
jgi:hypothetical protein